MNAKHLLFTEELRGTTTCMKFSPTANHILGANRYTNRAEYPLFVEMTSQLIPEQTLETLFRKRENTLSFHKNIIICIPRNCKWYFYYAQVFELFILEDECRVGWMIYASEKSWCMSVPSKYCLSSWLVCREQK